MIRIVSTCFFNSSIPAFANSVRFRPSKAKGNVTIATVRISSSLAASAITGAAPVPVPPPIPAVMKSILVLSLNNSLISSIFSIAEFLPTAGFDPAPRPSVRLEPNWIFVGIGLSSKC